MYIPAKPDGALAGHHWSAGIGPATPVAHKGIAAGAKALAATMIDLAMNPDAVAAIHADFKAQLEPWPEWKSLIPPGSTPPIHLNEREMGRYRQALMPFEYDPGSAETYLEFLGLSYPPPMPPGPVGKESNRARQDTSGSSIDWTWR